MGLSLFNHTVNIFLGHAAIGLNRNLLFLARAEVFSRYMHNTVGIDIEGNFNLRNTTRCRRNIGEFETAERLVAGSHFAFALQNMDINGRLVISSRGEYLALMRRNRRVALDNLRADTAEGFDTEGQRRNVEEQYVLNFADQYTTLNSSTNGYAFIRVYALGRFFGQELTDSFLHSRDTGRTTNEDNLADVAAGKVSVSHSLARRFHRTFYEVTGQFIELSTGQRQVEMFRARSVSRDERQVDVGLRHAGKLNLSFFSSLFETLRSHLVLRQVNAVFLLEFFNHPVHNLLVKVITTEVSITIGSQNFERTAGEFEDRYIERTTAEVEYENRFVFVLVEAVSQGSCRRFVDDTQNFEAGNLTSIFGSLTLAVVEVSRNRDYSLADSFAKICLSVSFQFLQNHSRDFLRRVILAINADLVVIFAHVAFDGCNRAVRVGHSLALSQLTNEALAVLRETYNRRGDTAAFRIRDDSRLAAFHNGYNGVRCT